ncbi:spermidine/putrescine ABC transporter ATP-binding protein [Listeria fleischmannii FSL S10-1203]|uniref:Spermidine/putrescine ABC transporter ATP-binding protein n=1 Tax=Listeria fleischmannii FSL S10-1203 TaxID=1265822 RepID=W7DLC6_9LIST|nr:spermidine/putrescine ABC transporter ATP-binding protein [Listeria fleischmannii FSL S10-1203]
MNGLCTQRKKAKIGDEIGLTFDAEAIHVMRLGETEAEFDKRLESYDEVE